MNSALQVEYTNLVVSLAICADAELDLDEPEEENIIKLRKRYGEKYSNEAAQARADKDGEEETAA